MYLLMDETMPLKILSFCSIDGKIDFFDCPTYAFIGEVRQKNQMFN